jgi:uncharacterized glyoxalase superfamily protein PhnB
MIDWLCNAFGFEKRVMFKGERDLVMHAELTYGGGMIMIGSMDNGTPSSTFMTHPDATGGLETQTCYFIVDAAAIEPLYASATRAGAVIVFDLQDDGRGGRSFTCRDPEGHVWQFGTFDPWAQPETLDHPDHSSEGG